jgi:hypothetical protein
VLVVKVVLEDLVVVAEFEEGLVVVVELLVDGVELLVDEVEEAGGTVPGGPPTAIRVCWLET